MKSFLSALVILSILPACQNAKTPNPSTAAAVNKKPNILLVMADDEFVGGEMQNGKWMRQGPYKAVTVSPPYGPGVWRLYDVVKDPGETRDLAAEKPAKRNELQEAWEQYARDVGVVLTN